MKYKGFIIEPVYMAGSDFRITSDGRAVDRKPTSKDIEFYEILDPMEDMECWIAKDSIKECKETIDNFLKNARMKDNKPETWELLK